MWGQARIRWCRRKMWRWPCLHNILSNVENKTLRDTIMMLIHPPPPQKMHHVSVIYPYGTRFIRQPSSSNRYAFYWILLPHKIHVLKFCVVKILISYISVSSEDLHLLARSVKYFITIAERVIIYIFLLIINHIIKIMII